MLRTLKNSKRLLGIVLVFAQEDALFIFRLLNVSPFLLVFGKLFRLRKRRSPGENLCAALERLGPAFIKLGQALSTRSDLIGDELADALSRLRDRLPPFPTEKARAIIEEELHAPVGTLFKTFEDAPVAAASIAQVHRATTPDGRDVAVKILRPGIETAFSRDLELFFWIAEIMETRLSGFKRLKPLEIVRTLKESVFFELDLRFEAAAATELADNIKNHACKIRVPQVNWPLTSKRVLTAEWIDGIALSDVEAIRASGFDIDSILTQSSRSLFSQVFEDGFFHADLHPGNLFVDANGQVCAVDFGIMGRLDWKSRLYIAEILRGFLTEDYRHVAEVHFAAGYVPAGKSLEAFTQACMAVAKPVMGKPLNEISVAQLLGQMFKIAAEFEMETQPQLLLMQKTMMVAEGVGRMLNPRLNMWELARPLIENWAQTHFGLGAKLKNAAQDGGEIVRKFPLVMGQIEQAINRFADPAGVKIHPASLAQLDTQKRRLQRKWLWFSWCALLLAAGLALASMFR